MTSSSIDNFWRAFCDFDSKVGRDTPYQSWFFGNSPEMAAELAELVLAGKKTGTASLKEMNELHPEDAPRPNGYSVVTGFDGKPLCVIRTTDINHLPFNEVGDAFAASEGEGDLTLEYWRRVHWDSFAREAEQNGFDFDERSIVCCERFELLFPA